MNTTDQTVVIPDLAATLRTAFAAEAATVLIERAGAPPVPPTRRQRFRAWRRTRAAQPVATWAVGLCYGMASAIILELVVLAMRRYGVPMDWVRFAGSWPA